MVGAGAVQEEEAEEAVREEEEEEEEEEEMKWKWWEWERYNAVGNVPPSSGIESTGDENGHVGCSERLRRPARASSL